MTTALIDGDIAAYRASVVTQRSYDFADGLGSSVFANPDQAARAAIETIRLWQATAKCNKVMVALTGRGNFRKLIMPTYKSNRSGVERPLALEAVRAAIQETFPTVMVDGLEADDLLGMALTLPKARGKAVCVTIDKDLRGVPGLHLNPLKSGGVEMIMEAEANRTWFMQALTGDASDGYSGCPGVGPSKAAKMLAQWDGMNLHDATEVVAFAFGLALKSRCAPVSNDTFDLGRVEAMRSLRVSRILRCGDYDKATREVLLWHPTNPDRLTLPNPKETLSV